MSCRLSFVDFDGELLLEKAKSEEVNLEFIKKYAAHMMEGL